MERFETLARELLAVDPGDYYYEEYMSGLDHLDISDSQSDLFVRFYNAGKETRQFEIEKLKKRISELESDNEELRHILRNNS